MTARTSWLGRIGALLIAASVLLSACAQGSGGTGGNSTAALGSITIRLAGDWPHFEVLGRVAGGGLVSRTITSAVYDSLVFIGQDPKDRTKSALLPYLATSWEQSPSKITFKIRSDATCPDGSKVTPSLIKQNADIRVNAPLQNFWGAGPVTTVADDAANTFTINFGSPASDGIYGFTLSNGLPIVCPAGLKDASLLTNGAAGSGPYTIELASHADQVVLKRRDDWKWGPNGITAKELPEKITYKVITNDSTAANLLLTGAMDVADIGGADVTRLQAQKSLINKSAIGFFNSILLYQHETGHPTADIKVREALTMAIDQKQWNVVVNQGRGIIGSSFLMPKADCYDTATSDLLVKSPGSDKARQLLLANGYTARSDGYLQKDGKPLTINLVSTNTPGLGGGADYLASVWDKAGVTVKTEVLDSAAYLARGRAGTYDALPFGGGLDQPNPTRLAGSITGKWPPPGGNYPRTSDPVVEAAVVAATTSGGAERCMQWGIVQRGLLKDFSIVPLATPQVQYFAKGIDYFPQSEHLDVRFLRRAN